MYTYKVNLMSCHYPHFQRCLHIWLWNTSLRVGSRSKNSTWYNMSKTIYLFIWVWNVPFTVTSSSTIYLQDFSISFSTVEINIQRSNIARWIEIEIGLYLIIQNPAKILLVYYPLFSFQCCVATRLKAHSCTCY